MDEEIINFTPRELGLFRKLLFMKSFEPGTLENIAKQIDGAQRGPITRDFLKKMVEHSCLTFEKTIIVGNGRECPIYKRDKKAMVNMWKKTIYFKVSKDILEERAKEGPFGIDVLDELLK
jgi:hypothetical protein